MGMYLSKKIGIPSTSELNCIEWNQNTNFIATGGTMGTLKIVKLDTVKGSNSLSVNQALEGHSSTIVCAAWNEMYQKLTTSDTSGLIIVWGMHNDSWFEEMINNRNKSTVCGMGWNCDGTKIAIAYADGQVIVGTMEGNRIWNKDLPNTLAACEWAPDGNTLLFGTTEGEVHVYDPVGNFVQKIHMVALETVELEAALANDLKKEQIIDIKWYYPTLRSKVVPHEKDVIEPIRIPTISQSLTFEESQLLEGITMPVPIMPDRPRLLVAYSHGVIQLMRTENDPHPIIVRFPHFVLTRCRWSPNGAFVAVTGFQTDMPKNEQAVIHIMSAYGKMISFLRIKDTSSLTGVAWDPSGLRIAVTTDSNVYFGNIRPQYKWGYIGRTVIYVFEKVERNQFSVVFYETKIEETFSKTISKFEQIACHDDFCVIVNRQDDPNGTYFAQLCNSIGTALDFKYTDVEPHCVALNNMAAVIAGGESYFIWHFVLPKYDGVKRANILGHGKDDIIATLDKNNILQFFEIGDNQLNKLTSLERRDVWSYKWDSEKEDMIALNEKAKMIVLKGDESEEPVTTSGYICSFRGLTVRTVLVDNFLMKPEKPEKKNIQDIEIKSLRDCKHLLERMKIDEATTFIEKNPHPMLWKLLAEVALHKLDVATAEHAYVKLSDYAGISFCKRLQNITNTDLKRAEVFAHLTNFEKAEKTYIQCDRRDLAIQMYKDVFDYRSVLRLLPADGDDSVRMQVLEYVADYYFERQMWKNASEYYRKCNVLEKRIEACVFGTLFGELEDLACQLPDNHQLLEPIGDIFAGRGLCEPAVDCYIRTGLPRKAMSCCIELNFWDRANKIAKAHNLEDVESMLAKYAERFRVGSNEKSMAACQLYKRAGRFMDAAKLAFEIAWDEQKRNAPYTRLKKIHVMAALLVEQQRNQRNQGKNKIDATQILEETLNEEMDLSLEESKIMETAWRGAEAYHLILLAYQYLYQGSPEEGLRTALILTDYEDILEPEEILPMIVLAAIKSKLFAVASKAMMRLEALKTFTQAEQNIMKDLAISIFNTYPPTDIPQATVKCPSCETTIRDLDHVCPKCKTRFPICIASGKVLQTLRFWICATCKHRACPSKVANSTYCPLCHSTASFAT
ncbi:unnamed protein product [Caenorhabditis bovis]|uniref:Anaphase-promoting complex subunit 4 WD40 domain-containing protein n=1 Tax=Caenorhabditis bovis TaxID=2654633 RepID=A0A8S1EHS9_9PELO|nr:unnamed protein product [Caenorhabditis bovis]